jgi:hypothetical protein
MNRRPFRLISINKLSVRSSCRTSPPWSGRWRSAALGRATRGCAAGPLGIDDRSTLVSAINAAAAICAVWGDLGTQPSSGQRRGWGRDSRADDQRPRRARRSAAAGLSGPGPRFSRLGHRPVPRPGLAVAGSDQSRVECCDVRVFNALHIAEAAARTHPYFASTIPRPVPSVTLAYDFPDTSRYVPPNETVVDVPLRLTTATPFVKRRRKTPERIA